MFRFVISLFGCPHKHCTFPITATKRGIRSENTSSTTYVVCLDCGREFPYDWEKMKVVESVKLARQAVA
jgi:RNase P subunit RPR2